MKHYPAEPKDASAVILVNHDKTKVLWAQRNPAIRFLGGFHAFPGGKTDTGDRAIPVRNCADESLPPYIVCMVREVFEEVGVLLVRGGEKLTKGQRASLHDDLISGRSAFQEILDDWGLWIDGSDFLYTGYWTTPKFSPVRFKTRFFIAVCPSKQDPYAAITEMQDIEFIDPAEALRRWEDSEVLISPPVLISLQTLAASSTVREGGSRRGAEGAEVFLRNCAVHLLERSMALDGNIHHVEFNPHIIVMPLRTETLPPATHTNCFIVGREEFVVIDAASKEPDEQQKLHELVDGFIEKGWKCRQIIVSHLHKDHFGGETVLREHLNTKHGIEVPITGHRLTAESLEGQVDFDGFLSDNEVIDLKDEKGRTFPLTVLHTPGHARGHLCFYDEQKGFLLSSDNVINTGSVVIAHPEGNMTDYLDSLERMKSLPGLRFLCGSHGSAVFDAKAKIQEFIDHRLDREAQVLEAYRSGLRTAEDIAGAIYRNLDERIFALAVRSVTAHLQRLGETGKLD